MNSQTQTELEILDMYFEDGMKEVEIAEVVGVSLLRVHEVLYAFEATQMRKLAQERALDWGQQPTQSKIEEIADRY